MALLFGTPIQKQYRASRFSCSYFFCWVLFLIVIILPFFLAFSTHEFWKKREIYEEQPVVLYRKEIIIMAYTADQGTLVYSSLAGINDLFFEDLSPMLIQSSLIDYNFDSKPDLYEFNITMYETPSYLRNIKIMTFYDYRLRDRARMDMITMGYADIDTPIGASTIYIDGWLNLKETQNIRPSSIVLTTYNHSLIDTTSSAEMFLPSIISAYNDRNVTTSYDYGKPLVLYGGQTGSIDIKMKVRIPANQPVVYRPVFLETMKFAWIQYVSLLIPVAYVVYLFANFVYGNQILEASVTYDTKKIAPNY
ncbi:unnamed protein product [Blepharisma stoltei]|uniref:Transmembrane protein 231 n=1 Tax=Blepharisma stoltei TaxID=1481888 RepID=A0AAU9J7E5_9CILI|nr:unnamed protein product [Blepharisma stoltei]